MDLDPGSDEAPFPEAGADVWVEGTLHGPLPAVISAVDGDELSVGQLLRDGESISIEDGQLARIAYRVQGVPCAVPVVAVGPPGRSAGTRFRRAGPSRRFQRRNDFRIEDTLTARVWPITDEGLGTPLAAVTTNLSAAGALVRAAAGLREGQEARLELDLGEERPLVVPAAVVRVEDPGTGIGELEVALSFSDLAADEERLLRGHVMDRQRRERRGELGLD